jgi:hypothetical protein
MPCPNENPLQHVDDPSPQSDEVCDLLSQAGCEQSTIDRVVCIVDDLARLAYRKEPSTVFAPQFGNVYHQTEEDARTAFEAIAAKRIIARCECDSDVGVRCKRCDKLVSRGGDVMQYESELAYRYGQHLMARHLLKVTKHGE